MSLYYEAAEFLAAPNNAGGSLKSRIFNKKDLKSQPAQIYALVIETCKWSAVLKEVIEKATLLALEKKLTPILSLLLTHDLLLAKRGIALPATHGLRTSVERHKARIQAEFTKARVRRNIASLEAFRNHIEAGDEEAKDGQESLYPRWIRINTLKTTLEEQIQSTFAQYTRVESIDAVRKRGSKCFFVDEHIPNLIALSANISLAKSEAYKKGDIIFQDKASCFPAYLLNPTPEDGLIIDTCAAPGNKTTHLAAILTSQSPPPPPKTKNQPVLIHAFEKNKLRAGTLENMVTLARANHITKIHAGQDFLQVKPNDPAWKDVGALLLDPSCSGSGIVGRDEMPELHLPTSTQKPIPSKPHGQIGIARRTEARKRKRDEKKSTAVTAAATATVPTDSPTTTSGDNTKETMIDDDGTTTALSSPQEYTTRLQSLSTFQLSLLTHAFAFPSAKKITYSTCSIHAEENEHVVIKALNTDIARTRGWRVLERGEQVEGLRRWPVRGVVGECGGEEEEGERERVRVAEGCVRTNLGDGFGTMGFFVVGFVRDGNDSTNETAETSTSTSTYNNGEDSSKAPTTDNKNTSALEEESSTPQPAPKKNKKRKKGSEKVSEPVSELAASETQNQEQEQEAEEWTGFDSENEENSPNTTENTKKSNDSKSKSSTHQPPLSKKQKLNKGTVARGHAFSGKGNSRSLLGGKKKRGKGKGT